MKPNTISVLFVLLAIVPFFARAQKEGFSRQNPPRSQVGIDYVEVDVVVTDADGNRVGDLRVEDFEVLEDGVSQDIVSLQVFNIPAHPTALPVDALETPESDVRSNQPTTKGRVFVLVLDDLHTDPSRNTRVQNLAQQFVEQWIGAEDLVAVVQTSGKGASSTFSSDRASLLKAVEGFRGSRLRSTALARLERDQEMQRVRPDPDLEELELDPFPPQQQEQIGRTRDPLDGELKQRGAQTLRTLGSVCRVLEGIKGRRKAVVFISEGLDYSLRDLTGARGSLAFIDEMRKVIGDAGRANVSIYSMDPAGVDMPVQGVDVVPVPTGVEDIGSLQSEGAGRQDILQLLSVETGGFATLNQGRLVDGLRRIAEDNGNYYLLGYYPKKAPVEGEYRPIRVRVNRPGLRVRSRSEYAVRPLASSSATGAARKEGKAPAVAPFAFMDEESPLPLTGIPLQVFAAPYRLFNKTPRVSVLLHMEIEDFDFAARGEKLRDEVEIRVTAFDRKGKLVERRNHTLKLDLGVRSHQSMLRHGLRALSGIDLRPGDYRLRVFVLERGGDRRGSVFYDLEVPSCGKRSLTVGGLFLGSLKETIVYISAFEEEKESFSFPPSTRRAFEADDEILIQTEVCNTASPQTEVSTLVRGSDGTKVVERTELYDEARESEKGIVHDARVPLEGLAPGKYVLEVVARDPVSRQENGRKIHFEIIGSGEGE